MGPALLAVEHTSVNDLVEADSRLRRVHSGTLGLTTSLEVDDDRYTQQDAKSEVSTPYAGTDVESKESFGSSKRAALAAFWPEV